jgi:hypothetical protein
MIASSSTESSKQCQEPTNPHIHNAMPLWEAANHIIRTYTCKHSKTCSTKPGVGVITASLDLDNKCNRFTFLSPASTDGPIPCPKIPTKCVSFQWRWLSSHFLWLTENHERAQSEQFRSRFEPGTSQICEKRCHMSQFAHYQMYKGVVITELVLKGWASLLLGCCEWIPTIHKDFLRSLVTTVQATGFYAHIKEDDAFCIKAS